MRPSSPGMRLPASTRSSRLLFRSSPCAPNPHPLTTLPTHSPPRITPTPSPAFTELAGRAGTGGGLGKARRVEGVGGVRCGEGWSVGGGAGRYAEVDEACLLYTSDAADDM
eukprot:1474948-Rhodomonas_salina.1